MSKVTIIVKVERGNITHNRELVVKNLQPYEGKYLALTFAPPKKNRSNKQNAFYHGVIIPIVQIGVRDVLGHKLDHNQIHEFLRDRFNYTEAVHEPTGEIIKLPKSTTTNSTTEQEEYHLKIKAFALDYLGVTIPDPNEQIEIKL